MEQWIINLANSSGGLAYLAIFAWTFLEGETIVLITAAAMSGGIIHLNVWLLLATSFFGSFAGDQTWFAIGRRYGTKLLRRWPKLAGKAEGVFRRLDRHNDLFILSFRFLYGLRNISPFAIGMTQVSRTRFLLLNAVAAAVWANAFVWGGYSLGRAFDHYFGPASQMALGIALVGLLLAWWLRGRVKTARYRNSAPTLSSGFRERNG